MSFKTVLLIANPSNWSPPGTWLHPIGARWPIGLNVVQCRNIQTSHYQMQTALRYKTNLLTVSQKPGTMFASKWATAESVAILFNTAELEILAVVELNNILKEDLHRESRIHMDYDSALKKTVLRADPSRTVVQKHLQQVLREADFESIPPRTVVKSEPLELY